MSFLMLSKRSFFEQKVVTGLKICPFAKEFFILANKTNSLSFQISYHLYMLDKYSDNSWKMHYVFIMYFISTHEQPREKIIIYFVPYLNKILMGEFTFFIIWSSSIILLKHNFFKTFELLCTFLQIQCHISALVCNSDKT